MDEQNVEHRKPVGRFTWLWMVFALALVGGFLVWLGAEAEPTQIQVVEEEEEPEDPAFATPEVPLEAFAANTQQYEGRDIRLSEIPVASLLSSQMFWTELPGEQEGLTVPYLIALDTVTVADSIVPEAGEEMTVVGQVFPVTDSVLDGWVESGMLEEAQRLEAEFATSFMQVRQARPAATESSSGGDGDDSAASDQ